MLVSTLRVYCRGLWGQLFMDSGQPFMDWLFMDLSQLFMDLVVFMAVTVRMM